MPSCPGGMSKTLFRGDVECRAVVHLNVQRALNAVAGVVSQNFGLPSRLICGQCMPGWKMLLVIVASPTSTMSALIPAFSIRSSGVVKDFLTGAAITPECTPASGQTLGSVRWLSDVGRVGWAELPTLRGSSPGGCQVLHELRAIVG